MIKRKEGKNKRDALELKIVATIIELIIIIIYI